MSAVELPPVDVLRRRATARVDALRPVVTAGAALIALEVSGIQRFVIDGATDGALEMKARSLLAAILPSVLAWRARTEAGLGAEHEVLLSAGRAVLAVPRDRREAVTATLRRDALAIQEGTADALAVDVAWRDLPGAALEAPFDGSFGPALEALLERGLEEARHRRAEGAPDDFWTPAPSTSTPPAPLGPQLRTSASRVAASANRIAAVGVASAAAAGADAILWPPLGIAITAGASIADVTGRLEGPRLLLRIDALEPDAAAPPGDHLAELPLAGLWIQADGDAALDLTELPARAAGDPTLAALRLDIDALGRALHDVAAGKPGADGLRDRLALEEAAALARGPIADAVTSSAEGPRGVQQLLAGTADLLLIGAWSEIVDLAAPLRDALIPGLQRVARALGASKAADALDASAGIAISPPGAPLARLVDCAGEELHRAQGERRTRTGEKRWKRALSWSGVPIGWQDLRLAVALGSELARAISARQVPSGVLWRLAAIHALFRRHEEALDAGATRDAAAAAKRRWLWAYQLGRAQAHLQGDGARLIARLSKLALDDVDEGNARRTEQEAAAWLGIVAEIAHRRTRARVEDRE